MEDIITQIAENTWAIQDTTVRFFLLTGSKRALLIDTGKTFSNVKQIVQKLTDLPLTVVNTHTDADHTHCNHQFETIYMHPAEMNVYHNYMGGSQNLVPVWDNEVWDLGDRPVQIIHTPGHTPGSITFLDKKNRLLIGGDGFQDGSVYLYGAFRDLMAWGYSLDRLIDSMEAFDYILPSHATPKISSRILLQLKSGYQKLLQGELTPEYTESFGTPIRIFDIGACKLMVERSLCWEK